ncbi:hypothetical protein QCA50_007248 [Cerrena zonata]|uniref:F-box domain-containing protein n=1 Tax=Cerrena zonata TaxID=2478898 RepID=A0AAW0G9I5_9APHY
MFAKSCTALCAYLSARVSYLIRSNPVCERRISCIPRAVWAPYTRFIKRGAICWPQCAFPTVTLCICPTCISSPYTGAFIPPTPLRRGLKIKKELGGGVSLKIPQLVPKVKSLFHRKRRPVPDSVSSSPIMAASSASLISRESSAHIMMPELPTEVWEHAIDLLVEYYICTERIYNHSVNLRNDLLSCALVCHAWYPRAQMHLGVYICIEGSKLSIYEKLIHKVPILCTSAREFDFRNQYIENPDDKVADRTVETVSHAVRVAHKLPHTHTLIVNDINLSLEHPHLSRYVTALTSIKNLKFYTSTPTRLAQLARFILGFRNISTLLLGVSIAVKSNHLLLTTPCYKTKSSLTRLYLSIQPGGHLLLDWLVKLHSFTTSLQILQVILEDPIPQSEVALTMQDVQSLLNNCGDHLKDWYFQAKIKVDNFMDIPPVSLAIHSAIKVLAFRVSNLWFRYALHQLQTVTSKTVIGIQFLYWLDETEKPALELWGELDDILDADHFASLIRVDVGCVYKGTDEAWHVTEGFSSAEEFPKLLPKLYERKILTWSGLIGG